MPTYGYRCTECGNEFDVWQRMSDEPVAACPACGAPGKRLFFPAGIVFKGSGFYKTDSRGASSAASAASSSSGSSSSASSSSGPANGSASSSKEGSTKDSSTSGSSSTAAASSGGGA